MVLPTKHLKYQKQMLSIMAFACSAAPHSAHSGDITSIQSVNLTLQNTIVHSSNSGSVSSSGSFSNSEIAGGQYNSMSVTASGVVVSASNITNASGPATQSGTSNISGLSITAQNSGSINTSSSFQGTSLVGNHNGMNVQATGSSISLSNIRQ